MKSTPAIKPHKDRNFIGLDVGNVRIGVARINSIAKIPSPLAVVQNNEGVFDGILQFAKQENSSVIVVGIPRNLDGEETAQSAHIRQFADILARKTDLKIVFCDESLSTKRAEAMIKERGLQPDQLDAVAACFILEEFINNLEN